MQARGELLVEVLKFTRHVYDGWLLYCGMGDVVGG